MQSHALTDLSEGDARWGSLRTLLEREDLRRLANGSQPAPLLGAGMLPSCIVTLNKALTCLHPDVEPVEFVPGNPAMASSVAPEADRTRTWFGAGSGIFQGE